MFAGFDTSNYTTSAALFDGEHLVQKKKLLQVKPGERGLRQSDAVFQHTVNMPQLLREFDFNGMALSAVAVSSRPRNVQGSYMPCFLVGEGIAEAVSAFMQVPLFRTSHQVGHILAALYSADKLCFIQNPFIAFHLSGGTTEALLVTPDEQEVIKAEIVAQSTDLKAGQAVDRAGVMLGLQFPCGKELDRLSLQSERTFKIRPPFKGLDCSLSGVENKAVKMYNDGEKPEDIARFVISYIISAADGMLEKLLAQYGDLPVVFSGGVSGNSLLQAKIKEKYNAYFAAPEFSSDNAAGTAIYAYLKFKSK